MSSLKPYPEYKDSGVDWLGTVPAGWAVIRSDGLISPLKNLADPSSFAKEEVYHYSIPVVQNTGSGRLEPGATIDSAKWVIDRKVILVSKLNPRKATVCAAERQEALTISSTEFVPIYARSGLLLPYLHFLMRSEQNRQRLDARVTSATRSHQRVNPREIYKFWFACPPLEDQQAIASFLDRETAEIDAFIADQEQLIALLNERRAATITQAVIKGLNYNVHMKDSGVEWIGKVPVNWDVSPLKRLLASKLKYGANEPAESDDPLWPRYLRITDFGASGELREDTFRSLPPDVAADYLVRGGDVLLARSGATVGKSFLVPEDGPQSCFAGYLIRAECDGKKLLPRYFYYFTKSAAFTSWKNATLIMATIQNIGADRYAELSLPVPPLEEQKELLDYLDRETVEIDAAIVDAKEAIELSKERRAALISAAVTGKVDVRDHPAAKGIA